jgi:hypothetical protein
MLNECIKEHLSCKPWRFIKFNERPKALIDEAVKTFNYDKSVLDLAFHMQLVDNQVKEVTNIPLIDDDKEITLAMVLQND